MELGKIAVTITAEGAKKAEQDILKVEEAFSKTAKSMTSKTPSVEYFLKRFGVGLAGVSAAAVGLYALIKAGPVAYAYWQEFGEIIGVVSDTIVMALSPAINVILGLLWGFSDWFANLPAPVQGAVGALGIIVVAIGLLGTVISWLSGGFAVLAGILGPIVIPILSALGGVVTAVAGAIAGLGLATVAAAAIIVAAVVLLYLAWTKNWYGIRDITGGVLKWISERITEFKDWIVKEFTVIGEFVGGVWRGIRDTAKVLWDSLISIFDGIKKDIMDRWTALKDWIMNNPIVQVIKTVYETASSMLGGRQVGGSVSGGASYIVGERGPELFTPRSGGSITPNSQLGGSGQALNLNLKVELDGRQIWQSVRQYSSAELRRLGGY